MFDNLFLANILSNPLLFGLLVSIVRNIGGYFTECFRAHRLLPYSGSKLLETLTLYETFFVTLGGMAGLPSSYVVPITAALDVLRSFRKVVEDQTSASAPQPTSQASDAPTMPEGLIGTYQGWNVYVENGYLSLHPPQNLTTDLGLVIGIGSVQGYSPTTDFMAMARKFIDAKLAEISAPDYHKGTVGPVPGQA
jgi:hypothetical protein